MCSHACGLQTCPQDTGHPLLQETVEGLLVHKTHRSINYVKLCFALKGYYYRYLAKKNINLMTSVRLALLCNLAITTCRYAWRALIHICQHEDNIERHVGSYIRSEWGSCNKHFKQLSVRVPFHTKCNDGATHFNITTAPTINPHASAALRASEPTW